MWESHYMRKTGSLYAWWCSGLRRTVAVQYSTLTIEPPSEDTIKRYLLTELVVLLCCVELVIRSPFRVSEPFSQQSCPTTSRLGSLHLTRTTVKCGTRFTTRLANRFIIFSLRNHSKFCREPVTAADGDSGSGGTTCSK